MMNMEGEFLEEVGTVTKAAVLRKKEVQLNTRMHYTQRRCGHKPAGPLNHMTSVIVCDASGRPSLNLVIDLDSGLVFSAALMFSLAICSGSTYCGRRVRGLPSSSQRCALLALADPSITWYV